MPAIELTQWDRSHAFLHLPVMSIQHSLSGSGTIWGLFGIFAWGYFAGDWIVGLIVSW